MRSKIASIEEAVGAVRDGMTIMIGGFGSPGTPFTLIDALVRHGPKNLTIVKNDANQLGLGIDRLLKAGMVRKLIASHIGLNAHAVEMMNAGDLDVSFVSQGILAERIRAAGVGLKAIVTDIGIDTLLSKGKATVEIDGVAALIEPALHADVALIHAERSDTFGNLRFSGTARNLNPLMAMAADFAIAEVEHLVALGSIPPEAVHTPGPFIQKIVELQEMSEDYGIVGRS